MVARVFGHGYFDRLLLTLFDSCVLFCCHVFCSVSSSTDVHD